MVTVASFPGIAASEWTYNEEEGADVLYLSDWTWSEAYASRIALIEAAEENDGHVYGVDYPEPGSLGVWDLNNDGHWNDEIWFNHVYGTTFMNYDDSFGDWGDYYATEAGYADALDYLNEFYDYEVEFVSLPGFEASEWIYSEQAGEEVLYESIWTWYPYGGEYEYDW